MSREMARKSGSFLCIVAACATAIWSPNSEWGWFLFVAWLLWT